MNAAYMIEKKTISFANSIINTSVMIFILLLVVIGCYAIWDSDQVFQTANSARYEIYKPTIEDEGKSFEELQAINSDIFGWLTVYGTHIDYPVVQGFDNIHYVNYNAEGEYSLSGSIFLDVACNCEFSDFNSIIYGHHMEKQAMFGEIGCFNEKSYFDDHKYGMIYCDGKEHGLEFFAIVHADAYDGNVFKTRITKRKDRQAYIDMLLDRAIYFRDVQITADDNIILLSTCSASSTNGRDILAARITDEIYVDAFKTKEPENTIINRILTVDGLAGIWPQVSLWTNIFFIGLLFFQRTRFNKKYRHVISYERR